MKEKSTVGKARFDEKPKMEMEAKKVMNDYLDDVREFSRKVGSVDKVVPLNRRVVIGRFFKDKDSGIILPGGVDAARTDSSRDWIACAAKTVLDQEPQIAVGDEVLLDTRRWIAETNGMPCFIEKVMNGENRFYNMSVESVQAVVKGG